MRAYLLFTAAFGIAATAAFSQSPSDFLVPLPVDRADEPVAPADPGPTGPIELGEFAGDGPSFTLGGVVLDGATIVPEEELRPIWEGLIGQPVTVGALDEIAARIAASYRARGYVLSQAAVPAQNVSDGIVRILVVEGYIDRVTINGGAEEQQIAATQLFAPIPTERPLRLRTLERSVLLSRDTFGGSVETVLEPSPTTFAAADLNVVLTPDPFVGFATTDNRGSRLFGSWSIATGGSWYNALGDNERIDGLIAFAPRQASLGYAELVYDRPIFALAGTDLDGGRLELRADMSRAEPDLTRSGIPEDLAVKIDETNLGATLIVPFRRSRDGNIFGRFGLTWRDSESRTSFAGSAAASRDRLWILESRGTFDWADRTGGVTLLDAAYRQGVDSAGAKTDATGPAAADLNFSLATVRLARLQRVGDSPWSVWVEAIGQVSSGVVPNSERFSLGGGTIGRGFGPGNTSGDSGWGARAEIRRNIPSAAFGGAIEATELYVFADHGAAFDRAIERDGQRRETLASAGIGARIDLQDWLTLTPEIAHQTRGFTADTISGERETRFLIGLMARF